VRRFFLLTLVLACDGELAPTAPVVPARTSLLVAGPAEWVGDGASTCSSAAGADTWCAFARTRPDGKTELWVIDLDKAAAGPVACDGSSPLCQRITETLWTGQPISPPSHPTAHGFDGATLIFYADATSAPAAAYRGPIKAWRPGWTAARTLSSPQGISCIGHPTAEVAVCVGDAAQVGNGPLEFDVRAGALAAATTDILPKIDRIRARGARGTALMWRGAFSPTGDTFALSSPSTDGLTEVLRAGKTSELGQGPLGVIAAEAAVWRIANDGKKVYYLKGYNYSTSGTLMMADYPTGENPVELQPRVGRFTVLGEPGGPDQGLGIVQDIANFTGAFRILRDRTRPQELVNVDGGTWDVLLSSDLRYTFLPKLDDMGNEVGFIANNDGSGSCALNAKPGLATYNVRFLSAPSLVFWAEDSLEDATRIEGWYTDPQGCAPKRRFSDRLMYLEVAGKGVVFGEEEGSTQTMALKYASAGAGGLSGDGAGTPLGNSVTTPVGIAAGGRYVVFAVTGTSDQGLYVNGPLP
jgi:hypothetical protein